MTETNPTMKFSHILKKIKTLDITIEDIHPSTIDKFKFDVIIYKMLRKIEVLNYKIHKYSERTFYIYLKNIEEYYAIKNNVDNDLAYLQIVYKKIMKDGEVRLKLQIFIKEEHINEILTDYMKEYYLRSNVDLSLINLLGGNSKQV